MTTIHCSSMAEFKRRLRSDMRKRQKRIERALKRTAKHARHYIVQFTLPIAFRTLEKSIKIDRITGGWKVIATAPHAEAVELGSRPHYPPLAPLVAWVKLRGRQGLAGGRRRGTTTTLHARSMRKQLKALEKGGVLDAEAPTDVARAIQHAIGKHGTKPHHYMLSALPEVVKRLDVEIKLAVEEPAAKTGG